MMVARTGPKLQTGTDEYAVPICGPDFLSPDHLSLDRAMIVTEWFSGKVGSIGNDIKCVLRNGSLELRNHFF